MSLYLSSDGEMGSSSVKALDEDIVSSAWKPAVLLYVTDQINDLIKDNG